MTLGWADVATWDPRPLDELHRVLGRGLADLLGLQGDLDGMLAPAEWTGATAEEARVRRAVMAGALEDVVTELSAARSEVGVTCDGVTRVARAVTDARITAGGYGLILGDDGSITDRLLPDPTDTRDPEVIAGERADQIALARQLVDEAIALAEAVDQGLVRVLDNVLSGKLAALTAATLRQAERQGAATVAGGEPTPPPRGANARGNADWWALLTARQKTWVIKEHPDWIGNLDGIDYTSRDAANRVRLPQLLARYRAEHERIVDEMSARHMAGDDGTVEALRHQRALVDAKIRSLETLRQISQNDGRHIVLLRVDRERAEAAVAVGDLDAAERIAVFAPGLTAKVDDIGGYVGNMADLREKAQRSRAGDRSVATVVWLGYQAPQLTEDSLLSANSVELSGAARDGGHALADFYRGIAATHRNDPDVVALGHSYGSTTTGYALQEAGTAVDRAVFFGSPGLGVDRPQQLRTPAGSIYYLETDTDPVGDVGRFGADPSALALNDLTTHARTAPDGEALRRVDGHTEYLDNDTTSQYNIAQVVAGRPERAFAGRDFPIGELSPLLSPAGLPPVLAPPVLGGLARIINGE